MKRRKLLQAIAALSLQPWAWVRPAHAARAAKARTVLRRLRPADAGWPGDEAWQGLNRAVGGRLLPVRPLFEPCAALPQGAECAELTKYLRNPYYIGDQAAGTQVSGWLDAWEPAPPAYAVAARGTPDVVAAVDFARAHDLRLAVKGTGHSYQGTSMCGDALLVWTRAMNRVTLHERFVPDGCAGKQRPVPAVTAEAGAMWIDLYDKVTREAGRYVQGGGCADVGVAGLVQSGGFGSFSKAFGTAAASLLQAEVVTADGKVRTVNACREPDLFFALRGGGGGSWGVVTKLTLRTHELPKWFGAAWGKVKARSDEAYQRLVARFVAFYAAELFNSAWGESVKVGRDTLKVSMVCQGLDAQQANEVWRPFFDWVKSAPEDFEIVDALGAGAKEARRWWDPEGDSMIRDPREGAPGHHSFWKGDQGQVGAYLHGYDSVWMPAGLLASERQATLVDALIAGGRHKEVELHFNKGLAGAPAAALNAARETATNPAAFDAFALAIIADGEGSNYPGQSRPALDRDRAHENARRVDRAIAELRGLVPEPGSYVSESNYFNESWQTAFFGANYERLQPIKRKYDPDCLFFVHHGVGSEEWSPDGFTRLAQRGPT